MIDNSSSLDTIKVPVTCVTSQDYIKVIDTEQEFQQVIDLMKEIFPVYWKELATERLENNQLSKNKYILGYFTPSNKLVGSVRLRNVNFYQIVLLFALQVDKCYRGMKIATTLFKLAKQISRKKNYKYLCLQVDENNHTAMSVYKKWKFRNMPGVYLVKRIDTSAFVDIHAENPIVCQFLNKSDYKSFLRPFLEKHFSEYMKVFQQHKRMKRMIEKDRILAVNMNYRGLIAVLSPSKKDMDVYIPSTHSYQEIFMLLKALFSCEVLNFEMLNNIKIISFLKKDIFHRLNDSILEFEDEKRLLTLFHDLEIDL